MYNNFFSAPTSVIEWFESVAVEMEMRCKAINVVEIFLVKCYFFFFKWFVCIKAHTTNIYLLSHEMQQPLQWKEINGAAFQHFKSCVEKKFTWRKFIVQFFIETDFFWLIIFQALGLQSFR